MSFMGCVFVAVDKTVLTIHVHQKHVLSLKSLCQFSGRASIVKVYTTIKKSSTRGFPVSLLPHVARRGHGWIDGVCVIICVCVCAWANIICLYAHDCVCMCLRISLVRVAVYL